MKPSKKKTAKILKKPSQDSRSSKTRDRLELKVRHQANELRHGISKQKLSDEQLNIRTKAMEYTSDGIFLIDATKPDFPFIYVNQAFQTISGYTKKEILGQSYFSIKGDYPDPRTAEEIKSTLRQGKSFHGEMLNFRKNGEKYWNLLRITPMRDGNGLISHFIGLKTDVTLMKQKNAEIEEQREELLHVTRVGKLAEFVSSLAHEISQPLTAILSYAESAKRLLKDREPQVQEILQYIVNDDQRAAEVIRRLRVLLKKNKPTFDPIDMNALVNETVQLIATDVTVRNKTIKTQLAKNLPPIHGDRIQLQQVLLNLISNSLEAMDDKADARELLVRTSRKDPDAIVIEVSDSGCGIPKENLNKLFSHFFTTKPEGLGMGLSISRSIVEAHGGCLEAKNNPKRGATFYFTLSAVPPAEEDKTNPFYGES